MHLRSFKEILYLFLISAVVSTCGVFGVSYVVGEGWPVIDLISEIALSFLFTFIFAGIFLATDKGMDKLAHSKADEGSDHREEDRYGSNSEEGLYEGPDDLSDKIGFHKTEPLLSKITPKWDTKSILLFAIIMGICWLPWLIANFPGGTYWDTYYQMYQIYPENHPISIIPWEEIYDKTLTDAWLVDHQPVFTTLVYGAFGWVSDQLTGNWMAGVFIFVCIQGAVHVLVFTASIAYMRKLGCPLIACFSGYVFYSIMPFISTWALCMVKDSFFGLFFVLYFMMLFATIRTEGKFFSRKRNIIFFTLCALMLCLTKKTGIFVVVPTSIFLVVEFIRVGKGPKERRTIINGNRISYRSENRRSSASMKTYVGALLPAVLGLFTMCVFLPHLVFPALNIEAGGKQEVLGPMFQQTARYVVDHEDEITPEQHNAIKKVLDYSKLKDNYIFDFEDSVKYRYNLDTTDAELMDYFKVYIEQGLKHPDSYFGAIMCLAGFYVAPTAYANIRMVTVDTKMGEGEHKRYMLYNPDELDWLRNGLDDAYSTIASIPVLDLPLLIVTYDLWIPAALLFFMLRRRIRAGVLFVPVLVILFFCVIAPVYDARYVVPIFDIIPLFICSMLLLFNAQVSKFFDDGKSRLPRNQITA